jgi:hypothetical protein
MEEDGRGQEVKYYLVMSWVNEQRRTRPNGVQADYLSAKAQVRFAGAASLRRPNLSLILDQAGTYRLPEFVAAS